MNKKKFDTAQEYIDYLIHEKNIINPKNICILLILIGIIAIISLNLSKSVKSDFDWFEGNTITQEEIIETLLQAGYSEEEINKLKEEELHSLFNRIFMNNKGQVAGNSRYKEFPEQDAAILKQDYYLKASKGDFNFITTDFEDKKMKYYFSKPYNKELITIYNDAYYLKSIAQESEDSFKIQQVLFNIKDPQMLLYGALLTEEKHRRDIFVDKFSLSPILINKQITFSSSFSTSMSSINTLNTEKDDHFNEMAAYLKEGSYTFFRIKFYIDKNPLTAYMYKNTSDLKLSFYGIYSEDEDNIYLRVYDFIQMYDNLNNFSNSNNNNSTINIESNKQDITSNNNNANDIKNNNNSPDNDNTENENENDIESTNDFEEELNLD